MGWLDCMARDGAIPDVNRYLVGDPQNDSGNADCRGSGHDARTVDEPVRETNLLHESQSPRRHEDGRFSRPLFEKRPDLLQDDPPNR